MWNRNGDGAKRQKTDHSVEKMHTQEKKAYHPIASLKIMGSCPPIKGTLEWIAEWRSTRFNTRFLNFVLRDSSGEINGVIYRANCSEFEKKFAIGAMLTVENAQVKSVRDAYRGKSKSDYELVISDSLKTLEIESPKSDEAAGPAGEADSKPRILIRDLMEKIEPKQLVNVVGVITDVENIREIQGYGKTMITRNFRIIDESTLDIAATVWHDDATKFNSPVGTVVAMYQVAVRVQGAGSVKSLTFQKNTRLEIDPAIEVTQRLKNWYGQWKSNNDCSSQQHAIAESNTQNFHTQAEEKSTNTIEIIDSAVADSVVVKSPLISIREIHERIRTNERIDTAGFVIDMAKPNEAETINRKLKLFRKITMTDEFLNDITVEMWKPAGELDIPLHSVILVRGAVVSEFDGVKKLICSHDKINVDPDIPVATRLKELFTSRPIISGKSTVRDSISSSRVTVITSANSKNNENKIIENTMNNNFNVEPSTAQLISGKTVGSVKSNFKKIDEINERIAVGATIDVLGIIKHRNEPLMVQCTNGQKMKLLVELTDDSRQTIWMVIWGSKVKDMDERTNMIVAVKRVQVRCWDNRKELSCTDRGSSLIVEPEIDEAQDLRKWLKLNSPKRLIGKSIPIAPLTQIGNLQEGKVSSILGILSKKYDPELVGEEYSRDFSRIVDIIDDEQKLIHVISWGDIARNFDAAKGSIIHVTNLRIFTPGEIYGAFSKSSAFRIDPPEFQEDVKRLSRWFIRQNLGATEDLVEESSSHFTSLEI